MAGPKRGLGTVVVDNDRAVRAFRRYGYTVQDLSAAWQRIGASMLADARQRVPVQSGALAASLRAGQSKKWASVRAGSPRVPYADIIEYGGYGAGSYGPHYIEAQPYLRPALDANEEYANSEVLHEVMRLAGVAGFH